MTKATEAALDNRSFGGREDALIPGRLPIEEVFVKDWGKWYRVQGLTGAGRDQYEADITVGRGSNQQINVKNARAKLIVLCVVDANGSLLFSRSDVPKLGEQPASAIQTLFEACRRASGLAQEDFDELTEGFGDAQNGAATSS